jgi:hypothetical protein
METTSTTTARAAGQVAVPFLLRDVEDLHDADLDGVLTDRLLDAEVAAASRRRAGRARGPVGSGGVRALARRAGPAARRPVS